MIRAQTLLAVAAVCLGALHSAQARDRVWLIGDGFNLENSQVQIEKNVLWTRDVLRELPGERELKVFFGDGDDPAPDITQWAKAAETAAALQPLARVYQSYYWNGQTVRSHQIDGVRGPASRDRVRAALRDDIADMRAGDRAWFIYAGHGGRESQRGLLNLWGDTRLDADDLTALMAAQPADTNIRMLFTQCYAGSFHPVVMASTQLQANPAARCAFYAVPAEQASEGCSASLDVADYRGYGTYFFAALAGRSRDGTALPIDPDRNRDGTVDPYEAHLYTLRTARSTDSPRSSSEQYLLDWAPWYLPLIPITPREDNPYRDIATGLMSDLAIEAAGDVRRALFSHRKVVQQQIRRLIYRQEQSRAQAAGAAAQLRHDLEARWPHVRYAYTHAFKTFLEEDLAAAQDFIQDHPLYADLVQDQDQYWVLGRAILELQRRVAQLDRIGHLQQLARVRDAFSAHAGAAERARYAALLACEQDRM